MIDFTERTKILKNSIVSQHPTDYLESCETCGQKPTRGWAMSTKILACKCSVLSSEHKDGFGAVEVAWQTLHGEQPEVESLQEQVYKCHRDYNLFRSKVKSLVDHLARLDTQSPAFRDTLDALRRSVNKHDVPMVRDDNT